MTKYEIMYILSSHLTEEDKTKTMEAISKVLETAGAQNLSLEKWGERKLAYPINKKSTGFYVLLKFEIEGPALKEVELKLNINENLMRYIVVKED